MRPLAVSAGQALEDLASERKPASAPVPACSPGGAPAGLQLSCDLGGFGTRSGTLVAQAGRRPLSESPSAANDTPANEGPAGLGRGFSWVLAPVRWGGNVTSEWRTSKGADRERSREQVETATLRGASYIWQPWFAQVDGSLGLVAGQSASGVDSGKSRSSTVTGGANLALLPITRFPFFASADVSDSRAGSEFVTNDYKSVRLGFRQSYLSVDGQSNLSGSYNRSMLESSNFGRDIVDALSGSMTRRWDLHSVAASGNHSRNVRSGSGDGATNSTLSLQHGFRPDDALSFDSLASISRSDFRFLGGATPTRSRSEFQQFSTFANWRPDEDVPLYVTAGARAFQANADTGTAASESRTLNGNVAANYELNPATRLTANAFATQTSSAGADSLVTSESVGVTYAPVEPILLGPYFYRWSTGGNFTNQTGLGEARQRLSAQIGQNLLRNFATGPTSALSLNLGQSFGAAVSTQQDSTQTLMHNANLTYRISPNPSSTGYASLSATDARSWGGDSESEFQLINGQLTGQFQLSRYAFAGGNMTAQVSQQSSAAAPGAGFSTSTGGGLNYQHSRVFDVPQLRYFASYSVNESQSKSRLLGDVTATREVVTQAFEQRLEYRIGRLDIRLSGRIATVDGRRNSSIFLRLGREFGGF